MRLPDLSLYNLQTRLLAAFVLLMVAVGSTSLVLVHLNTTAAVRKTVGAEVVAGARAFERLLELDSQRLIEGARLLAADPAFRETATTAERGSLGPVLAKHGQRIGSAVMLLVDGDRRIVAGTLAAEIGKRFSQSKLLDRASAAQQATALVSFGGQLYQLVVVPLLAPQPVAWIAAGIRIDDAMAQEMRNMTGLDVTFLSRPEDGEWQARASTLPAGSRTELARDVGANKYSTTGSDGNAEFGDEMITRVINLAPRADDGAMAILQGSLPSALEPLRDDGAAAGARPADRRRRCGRRHAPARSRLDRAVARDGRRRSSRRRRRLFADRHPPAQGRARGSSPRLFAQCRRESRPTCRG